MREDSFSFDTGKSTEELEQKFATLRRQWPEWGEGMGDGMAFFLFCLLEHLGPDRVRNMLLEGDEAPLH